MASQSTSITQNRRPVNHPGTSNDAAEGRSDEIGNHNTSSGHGTDQNPEVADNAKAGADADQHAQQKRPPRTGIGRSYEKDGKQYVIDEADWEVLNGSAKPASQYTITVMPGRGEREQLSILSSPLRKLFSRVVKLAGYYADVSVDVGSISVYYPYRPLYFSGDELSKEAMEIFVKHGIAKRDPDEEAQNGSLTQNRDSTDAKQAVPTTSSTGNASPLKDSEPPKEEEQSFEIADQAEALTLARDFKILTHFYNKWVKGEHDKVRESLSHGRVWYSQLWALFEPGKLLFTLDDFEKPTLYVIAASAYRDGGFNFNSGAMDHITLPNILNGIGKSQKRFCLDAWNITWNVPTKTFSRTTRTFVMPMYNGTRPVISLPFYPLAYYTASPQADLLNLLETRGCMWKEYVSTKPSYRHHRGPARECLPGVLQSTTAKERINVDERVIVDHDGFGTLGPSLTTGLDDLINPLSNMLCIIGQNEIPVQANSPGFLHPEFDNTMPQKKFSALQAQLCPSIVNCCTLSSKSWFQISIDNLSEVVWAHNAFDHLVLDGHSKNMLRSLVEEHRRNKGRVMSDVIHGKGKGLVMVLHGPPGVGKTLTAESVAEYTRKPLFPINVGELTAEGTIIQKLQDVFQRASRWDAILLLDEADVVLEKRSFEDLRRNSIVSAFLRMLEYYDGVLFLTTNRLGTMDVAFQSRIQVAVKYKELTSDVRRQIWENFINRLDDRLQRHAKEDLKAELDIMSKWHLNGRQIRNVMTIAQSLALSKGPGSLNYALVEEVANETLNAQDFFEDAYRESQDRLGKTANTRSGIKFPAGK